MCIEWKKIEKVSKRPTYVTGRYFESFEIAREVLRTRVEPRNGCNINERENALGVDGSQSAQNDSGKHTIANHDLDWIGSVLTIMNGASRFDS